MAIEKICLCPRCWEDEQAAKWIETSYKPNDRDHKKRQDKNISFLWVFRFFWGRDNFLKTNQPMRWLKRGL